MENNQKKILVVDDEINVCKSIRKSILFEDYNVDMALSGEEALEMNKERRYDMVITDLMMPGISGVDLLSSLKAAYPETIVILVTGYPTIKAAVQTIKMGAFDFIPKPFTPDELRGLVARAFTQIKPRQTKDTEQMLSMPKDLYCLRGLSWVRIISSNKADIGVVYDFLLNIDRVIELELLPENRNVFQGEACARLTDAKGHIHRIWSPATGRISKTNTAVVRTPALLHEDPYGRGWLLQLDTTNWDKDKENLIRN